MMGAARVTPSAPSTQRHQKTFCFGQIFDLLNPIFLQFPIVYYERYLLYNSYNLGVEIEFFIKGFVQLLG